MLARFQAMAIVLIATAASTLPRLASAQEIRVGPDTRFAGSTSSRNSTFSRILIDGTVINAENARSTSVVLFAVRMERGRVVSRSESVALRIDLQQAATSQGTPLGTAISREQLLRLQPVAQVAETVGKYYVTATKGVSASDLTRQTGVSLTSLLEQAFSGSGGGGYGGGGGAVDAYGAGGQPTFLTENVLMIAVVPANPEERSRYNARPLALVY